MVAEARCIAQEYVLARHLAGWSLVVDDRCAGSSVDECAVGETCGDVSHLEVCLLELESVTGGAVAAEIGLNIHLIVSETGAFAYQLQEDGGVVGVAVKLGALLTVVRYRDIVCYEAGPGVGGAVEVVLESALEVSAYAERDLTLAVEKQKPGRARFGEVQLGCVVKYGEQGTGFGVVAGYDYRALRYEECVGVFLGVQRMG